MKRLHSVQLLVSATTVALLIGCSTTESTNADGNSPKPVRFGSEFTLGVSEQAALPNGLTIRLDSVTDDSRCPVDVQCVWQGNAAVHLVIFGGSGSGGGELPFVLNTFSGYTTDTTLRGVKIRLVSLDPDPVSTRRIEQSEYRVHLEVSQ